MPELPDVEIFGEHIFRKGGMNMAEPKNPVNWFEIPVIDMDRARIFYESVLGVELGVNEFGAYKMAFFPMVEGMYGTAGALIRGEGYVPSQTGIVIYFPVDDIEGILDKVGNSGGKTLVPKTAIGEYGFIAHFRDTEGNRLGLHSMK